jgi:hypothetical protein
MVYPPLGPYLGSLTTAVMSKRQIRTGWQGRRVESAVSAFPLNSVGGLFLHSPAYLPPLGVFLLLTAFCNEYPK